jgi:hypothetical protein
MTDGSGHRGRGDHYDHYEQQDVESDALHAVALPARASSRSAVLVPAPRDGVLPWQRTLTPAMSASRAANDVPHTNC